MFVTIVGNTPEAAETELADSNPIKHATNSICLLIEQNVFLMITLAQYVEVTKSCFYCKPISVIQVK